MLNISVSEFKKRVEYYLNKIKTGETLVIKEKDKSIAKVNPIINKTSNSKRPVGLASGDFVVPDDFDMPLPPDIQNLFIKE